MRKIVCQEFVSLDGVFEAPEKWHPPYFTDELGAAVGGQLPEADALLLGRGTYEVFAAAWPERGTEDPMPAWFNNSPKYVVSTTLKEPEWNNTTVIGGDVIKEIGKLKEQPGENIFLPGSGTLVRTLLAEGLLDELQLLVHPIVLGSGKRIFPDGTDDVPLRLVDSQTFSTGVLNLTYAPAAA
jgi:dihydrofolate reductase